MKKISVSLDIGGTEIKAASLDPTNTLLTPVTHFPAYSDKSAEQILENITGIIRTVREKDQLISRICFAFPGPFDYQNGICLIRGLDKYESLYGMNLREYFSQIFAIPTRSVRFCNDVAGFALGEMAFGQAVGADRAMFVCIGTGCGSAFGQNGKLCGDEIPGVPPYGYIYSAPFLYGSIDDYISKRGLGALSLEILGASLDGKKLEKLAQKGDKAAIRCFSIFGKRLRDALEPFLLDFKPSVLCIGGQITRSGALFLSPLRALCENLECRLYITDDTSKSAILGAALI